MFDMRPIAYVLGHFVIALGAAMLLPVLADLVSGEEEWRVFMLCSLLTIVAGVGMAAASAAGRREGLSIQQTFILTVIAWLLLPVFGALPFIFGSTQQTFVNAFFEAMSGITTTGATVLVGLDTMPAGILLWRGVLQWMGGLGVVVVAIAILPELKVGGMQLFRSEAFDTFGKILPQAAQIAAQLTYIYVGMTGVAILVYAAMGMDAFDALVHAMTTISTGGLANYDASFGHFTTPGIHYAAAIFMLLSALPYVRFVQLANGSARPIFRDPQIRTFLMIVGIVTVVLTLGHWGDTGDLELSFRAVLFNVISIITGAGYSTEDYNLWGPFAMMMFFVIMLIGGCAGSTSCSVKVFRYQVVAASVAAQIRLIHNPSGVYRARYDGRPISDEVLSSVMAFFLLFFLTLGIVTLALTLIGLDFLTSLSGAVACLANVGPGLGPDIGPSGNYSHLPDAAKWIMIFAMFVGRLELLSVFVLLMPRFWQSQRDLCHATVAAPVIVWHGQVHRRCSMPQYRRSLVAVGLAFGLLAAPLAQADEVTDALNDAIAAYEEGDLAYAKEMLDYASQLVAQQKAGTLTDLLPEPLDGWTAKEAESQNVGAAMFGGGTTAAREYSSEGKSLRIQYMADSPMLAQMGAMFANPALIGASGGKMTRIGRQTAMIEKNGNVQFMVDNRILVQIEGSASEDDKLAYAKAIDIKKLKDY